MAFTPQVVVRPDGRAHFDGILYCGSVHACPACALVIKTKRGAEVRTVVERHCEKYGRETAYLVSATVRHELGHDPKTVREGIARARRFMRQGRRWTEFRKSTRYVGEVNAVEVTHGTEHGWHPHHHSVMLFERVLTAEDEHWLKERWIESVVKALGVEHQPDYEHGLDVRRCAKADYLAKLGLELTEAMGAKRAKTGHRSALQIAEDFAKFRRSSDGKLWRQYAEAMFGCKQLNWTKGLRKLYGLGVEQSDAELANEAVQDTEALAPLLVESIAGYAWDAVRDIPRAKILLLEAAETGGSPAFREALESLCADPRARWTQPRRDIALKGDDGPFAHEPVTPQLEAPISPEPLRDRFWRHEHEDELLFLREEMHRRLNTDEKVPDQSPPMTTKVRAKWVPRVRIHYPKSRADRRRERLRAMAEEATLASGGGGSGGPS